LDRQQSKASGQGYFYTVFSRRKGNNVCSKANKEKVERLINENLIIKAAYDIIETAKQNSSYTILDEAEALVIPKDLEEEFQRRTNSKTYFLRLSRLDKRNILQWLVLSKREETRQKRIVEIVEYADQNQKPKQYRGCKNGEV